MEITIQGGSKIEITDGNIVDFENKTFQNFYKGIVVGNDPQLQTVKVLVIDPDRFTPMAWYGGEARIEDVFYINIHEKWETLGDYIEWKNAM